MPSLSIPGKSYNELSSLYMEFTMQCTEKVELYRKGIHSKDLLSENMWVGITMKTIVLALLFFLPEHAVCVIWKSHIFLVYMSNGFSLLHSLFSSADLSSVVS